MSSHIQSRVAQFSGGGTADVVVAWHQRLYVVMSIRWYRDFVGARRCAADIVDMQLFDDFARWDCYGGE